MSTEVCNALGCFGEKCYDLQFNIKSIYGFLISDLTWTHYLVIHLLTEDAMPFASTPTPDLYTRKTTLTVVIV